MRIQDFSDYGVEVGDTVLCVEEMPGGNFTQGNEYEVVEDYAEPRPALINNHGSYEDRSISRFEKVETPKALRAEDFEAAGLDVGDEVVCVEDNQGICFTHGKRYYVTRGEEVTYGGHGELGVISDSGQFIHMSISSFLPTGNAREDSTVDEDTLAYHCANPEFDPRQILLTTPLQDEEEDLVHSPAHYARFEIQPMEYYIRNQLPGHASNVVKYVSRAGHKLYPGMDAEQSEIKDLEKAIANIEARIAYLKGEPIVPA